MSNASRGAAPPPGGGVRIWREILKTLLVLAVSIGLVDTAWAASKKAVRCSMRTWIRILPDGTTEEKPLSPDPSQISCTTSSCPAPTLCQGFRNSWNSQFTGTPPHPIPFAQGGIAQCRCNKYDQGGGVLCQVAIPAD